MLKVAVAESLIANARSIQIEALGRMYAGNWRDASQKAWQSVNKASQALILEITGKDLPDNADLSLAIRDLAFKRGGQWDDLSNRYSEAAYFLHILAFTCGVYDDDLLDLVLGVKDYISLAEELSAGG